MIDQILKSLFFSQIVVVKAKKKCDKFFLGITEHISQVEKMKNENKMFYGQLIGERVE